MHFTAPSFREIKMDAEIGSYQEDDDPRRERYFVSSGARREPVSKLPTVDSPLRSQ